MKGGTRYHDSSRRCLFFSNEVEVLHGADPTTFWRGVVFVNGILDPDAIDRLHKIPIDVLTCARTPSL